MESPKNSLTPAQQRAVAARGNVLVMAGAGTGKTHTLVERCLSCLCDDGASLDEILVVTFTEAAAAEMRLRLRRALENKAAKNPANQRFQEQLALFDTAHIGTLHSFCLKLVREHFYELGLDPQLTLLDEGEARLLADETLAEQFQARYENTDDFSLAAQELIQIYGNGRDQKIQALVLRLFHYAQTRPDADTWLGAQLQGFSENEPAQWRRWLAEAIAEWRAEWLPVLENLKNENAKAAELLGIFSEEESALLFQKILAADENYPVRKKTALRKPLEDFFADAQFLGSLVSTKEHDPIAEDWNWARSHMAALVRLTQEFAANFSARKQAEGALDFHDLEQFALKLLWDFTANQPTAIARQWREKLRFVFVDEYQDINAAQDKIISALSRDGVAANRFLVGDVKQSIYRFRLADPKIFRDYAQNWRGESNQSSQTIPLSENFRSRESLLDFVNSLFRTLMRAEVGGVDYDDAAQLKFGAPESRTDFSVTKNPTPRAELLLRFKPGRNEARENEDDLADLLESDKEARLLALQLRELKESRHEIWDDEEKIFRPTEWRDMAVLLRAVAGKAEIYAKQFTRAGVPLAIASGGFFDSREILDLLSLLELLDNPLQDVPCLAVLRSPLIGLSLDELAAIRLEKKDGHFWFALNQAAGPQAKISAETQAKLGKFLERFSRWRKLARQTSLSQCLETVLAETHYTEWLRAQEQGVQRTANLAQFLNLAQRFDQFQRQGLFRFLNFIKAQREAGIEPDAAASPSENAVRLMSIHQSKGLEFPVVAVPDLAKPFNERDSYGDIIFDDELGLCPKVKPPQASARYPSLPHWLARRRERRELRGEELRLLYVAFTRARDTLILSASVSEKTWNETLEKTATPQNLLKANNYATWLGLWLGAQNLDQSEPKHLRWRVVPDEDLAQFHPEDASKETKQIPENPDAGTLQHLQQVLTWKYPAKSATHRAAKSSVTALRREAEELDDEVMPFFSSLRRPPAKLSAADTGTAHHQFLQHVTLEKCGDVSSLRQEVQGLMAANLLSAEEAAALDLSSVAAFWNSLVGKQIRSQPVENVRRELPFTVRFSPTELGKIIDAKPEDSLAKEFVVVQGVADLVVLQPTELWLVDFKTDAVNEKELATKIKTYAPQLKLYAAALEKIYSRPVTQRWLHFLAINRTEEI